MRLSARLSLSYFGFLVLLVVLVVLLAGLQLFRLGRYFRTLPEPGSPTAAAGIAGYLAESGLTAPIPEKWLKDTLQAGGWVQVVDRTGREAAQVSAPPDRLTVYTPPALAALQFHQDRFAPWMYELAPVQGAQGPAGSAPEQQGPIGTVILAVPVGGHTNINAYLPPSAILAFRNYFLAGFTMAVLTAIGLALLAGFWYARRLARPLVRLSDELKAAAAGDFSHRIEAGGTDEFAVLGQAYNHLAEQLEAAERERSRTEQARRDLVANISHDLRTPLTAIQGFTERLADEATPPEERRRYSEVVAMRIRDLDGLLGDLLQLSRLQALPAVNREPLDLAELVRVQVISLMPELEQAGLEVDVDLPADLPHVPADSRLIGRAVQNLLVNALRHSGGARRLAVGAGRSEDGVAIHVADDGRGIPAADLPQLFERYYQGTSATAQSGGSGLGLAIVRQIAEGHGGRITVAAPEGGGTAFTLWLPLTGQDSSL